MTAKEAERANDKQGLPDPDAVQAAVVVAASPAMEVLRALREASSMSSALAGAGAVLLASGVSWGLVRFLRNNLYLLVMVAGIACLVASALMCREGFVSYLPPSLQEVLLHKTIFDVLHEDTGAHNFFRRWCRMLLLWNAKNGPEVRALVEGLDPAFVDDVLRRPIVGYLPPELQRAMLPEPQAERGAQAPGGVFAAAIATNGEAASSKSNAVVASRAGIYLGAGAAGSGPPLSHDGIAGVLEEKRRNWKPLPEEPELMPAIANFGALAAGKSWQEVMKRGRRVVAFVGAALLAVPALLLGLRRLPWRDAATRLLQMEVVRDRLSGSSFRAPPAIALLGVGASLALTALSTWRCGLWAASEPKAPFSRTHERRCEGDPPHLATE